MPMTPCAHCEVVSESDDQGALVDDGWICRDCVAIHDHTPLIACADCASLVRLGGARAVDFGWLCKSCQKEQADDDDDLAAPPCGKCGGQMALSVDPAGWAMFIHCPTCEQQEKVDESAAMELDGGNPDYTGHDACMACGTYVGVTSHLDGPFCRNCY